MQVDEKKLKQSLPHIKNAIRGLEMLVYLLENKKISPNPRAELYYNLALNSMAAIQGELFTDDEYTESLATGLAYVSRKREYSYSVTSDNDGNIHYNINGTLPLQDMKECVLWTKERKHDKPVYDVQATKQKETEELRGNRQSHRASATDRSG